MPSRKDGFLSLRSECLDHFVIFGEKHLRHLIKEFVAHYNEERPHQGKENRLLKGLPESNAEGEILCFERLGGLLRHYTRAAAWTPRLFQIVRSGIVVRAELLYVNHYE